MEVRLRQLSQEISRAVEGSQARHHSQGISESTALQGVLPGSTSESSTTRSQRQHSNTLQHSTDSNSDNTASTPWGSQASKLEYWSPSECDTGGQRPTSARSHHDDKYRCQQTDHCTATATTTNLGGQISNNTGGEGLIPSTALGASLFDSSEQHSSAHYLGGPRGAKHRGLNHVDTPGARPTTHSSPRRGRRQHWGPGRTSLPDSPIDFREATTLHRSVNTTTAPVSQQRQYTDSPMTTIFPNSQPSDHHRTTINRESTLDSHHQQQHSDFQDNNPQFPIQR